MRNISRRDFLSSGLVVVSAAAAGPGLLRAALAAPRVTDGPFGGLRAPDANGLRLPRSFTSRVIARSGSRVGDYVWHDAPDGGATFELEDGWVYVSNSEVNGPDGGVGAIAFDTDGSIRDAYRICTGTSRNCAGGPTPWGTWLSCEEVENGLVWECDPKGEAQARPLPALGTFTHEAAAVDPESGHVYLTEDRPDGCFYRFVPDAYPSLDNGRLQVAVMEGREEGSVRWLDVPDPSASDRPTRSQVDGSARFDGGEGTWFDAGVVYFTTKGDDRVWAYEVATSQMSILYDASTIPDAPLRGVDNITGSTRSGDLFVAEDGGDLEIVMITPEGEVARLLRLEGREHRGSEIAGPALDPSGTRLYFSSQRGFGRGVTYEVTGPFRTKRPARPPARPSVSQAPLAAPGPERLRQEDGGMDVLLGGGVLGAAVLAAFGVISRRRRLREAEGRSDE